MLIEMTRTLTLSLLNAQGTEKNQNDATAFFLLFCTSFPQKCIDILCRQLYLHLNMSQSGVNFINILLAAFLHPDPKSKKTLMV